LNEWGWGLGLAAGVWRLVALPELLLAWLVRYFTLAERLTRGQLPADALEALAQVSIPITR
jgi:hypothetical protein